MAGGGGLVTLLAGLDDVQELCARVALGSTTGSIEHHATEACRAPVHTFGISMCDWLALPFRRMDAAPGGGADRLSRPALPCPPTCRQQMAAIAEEKEVVARHRLSAELLAQLTDKVRVWGGGSADGFA